VADEIYVIIETKCPHSGARLVIEQLGDEPKPDDRVVCPTHGLMGGREEIARQAV
jgi:nitrite reductase/ring-hydroxylating ferredoxin subunit